MDAALAEAARRLIDLALAEDLGERGDITSRFFVPEENRSLAAMVARDEAVLAGVEIAASVFESVDPDVTLTFEHSDGAAVSPGDTVLTIAGASRSLLAAERTALNFVQRLSGIATLTREFVRRVAGTGVGILDTRKTTPGWRLLEKAAVKAGGGRNHRLGLHDAAMVKDNHLAALGGEPAAALAAGVEALHLAFPGTLVEVEADRLDQARAFLGVEGVSVILLDNMSLDDLRAAVALRNDLAPAVKLEASGGVTLDTVAAIAETGVDFISSGALTHSARAADFGLDFSD